MDGEFIFGFNQRVKESIWEIDMKEIGQMESDKAMEYFIMRMGLNMKAIGKTIWNKDMLFILIKMVKFLI